MTIDSEAMIDSVEWLVCTIDQSHMPDLRHAVLLISIVLLADPLRAQQSGTSSEFGTAREGTVHVSIEDALKIAFERSYDVRGARLDVDNAEEQVQEAWGQLFPQVTASGSYFRNVVTANPFAGSDVSNFLGGGGQSDWVAYNERARQDDDLSTQPITFEEFQERQQEARREAGIPVDEGTGNPFGVANQFQTGVSLQQALFNRQAFTAVEGAQTLLDVNQYSLDREEQLLVERVREGFYQALLARQRVSVARETVERARETREEIARQVQAGTMPKAERLAAQVQLANQRTQFVQARNELGLARDNLKLMLGFPVGQPIRLDGDLSVEEPDEYSGVSVEAAVETAFEQRPDLDRARLQVELNQIQKSVTEVQYWPTISAVVDLGYSGRVPSDRTTTFMPDPTNPFLFETQRNTFFSGAYWNPSVSVGFQLSWNVFTGFQRAARIEQQEVAVNRAELQYDRLRQQVRLQVQRALRDLAAARQRIEAQAENVETAETNYEYALSRLESGVSSQLQVRDASEQLDQARIAYLRAVADYLTAKSAFEVAVGRPAAGNGEFQPLE